MPLISVCPHHVRIVIIHAIDCQSGSVTTVRTYQEWIWIPYPAGCRHAGGAPPSPPCQGPACWQVPWPAGTGPSRWGQVSTAWGQSPAWSAAAAERHDPICTCTANTPHLHTSAATPELAELAVSKKQTLHSCVMQAKPCNSRVVSLVC